MIKGTAILLVLLMSLTTTFAQEWQTDFTVAKDVASKENKPIILVFQGSDWCAPCIKLDREIWSTDTFIKYATKSADILLTEGTMFGRTEEKTLTENMLEKIIVNEIKRILFVFIR